jgi:hypothetical protein
VSTGNTSSASLSGLNFKTTYFWQARAVNANGTTYASAGEADYWSFTTQSPIWLLGVWTADGSWNKKSSFKPGEAIQWVIEVQNASTANLDLGLTYDVRDPADVQVVSWKGSMLAEPGITYIGLEGTAPEQPTGVYTFNGSVEYQGGVSTASTTYIVSPVDPPGVFYKLSPADGLTVLDTSLSLDWSDSLNAASYEFCIDTTDDGACANWTSTGTASTASLESLAPGITYYWQVRALNEGGTRYANDSESAYWSITRRAQEWLFVPIVVK